MSEMALPQLTPAQHRILARLVLGESDKQIAAALGLATKSVSNQLARVYRALAFADAGSPRVAAAVWYDRAGRAQPEEEMDGLSADVARRATSDAERARTPQNADTGPDDGDTGETRGEGA